MKKKLLPASSQTIEITDAVSIDVNFEGLTQMEKQERLFELLHLQCKISKQISEGMMKVIGLLEEAMNPHPKTVQQPSRDY